MKNLPSIFTSRAATWSGDAFVKVGTFSFFWLHLRKYSPYSHGWGVDGLLVDHLLIRDGRKSRNPKLELELRNLVFRFLEKSDFYTRMSFK